MSTADEDISFRAADRTYVVRLNVGLARRIKEALNLDLLSIVKPGSQVLQTLADDPAALVDVLWRLVETQATAAGIDQESFWNAMDDEALVQAERALEGALIRFFRGPKAAIVRGALKIKDKALERMARELETVADSQDLDTAIATAVTATVETLKESLRTAGG